MPVEPGGDSQRRRSVRMTFDDGGRLARPRGHRGPEPGDGLQPSQRRFEVAIRDVAEVGAQVGGLHGARAAARGHHPPGPGEEPAELRCLGEFRGAALCGVPAHHPDGGPARGEVRPPEFLQGIADGVVMQRRSQRGVQPVPLPRADAPLIHQRIGKFLVRPRFQACVEFLRRVQPGPVGVERHTLQPGKDQRAAVPEGVLHPRVEGAAEEDGAFDVQGGQRRFPAPQVQRLGVPAAHGHCPRRDQAVEAGGFRLQGSAGWESGRRRGSRRGPSSLVRRRPSGAAPAGAGSSRCWPGGGAGSLPAAGRTCPGLPWHPTVR